MIFTLVQLKNTRNAAAWFQPYGGIFASFTYKKREGDFL